MKKSKQKYKQTIKQTSVYIVDESETKLSTCKWMASDGIHSDRI